jgi:hypothetical protein
VNPQPIQGKPMTTSPLKYQYFDLEKKKTNLLDPVRKLDNQSSS